MSEILAGTGYTVVLPTPQSISLSPSTVVDNAASGTQVGTITVATTDGSDFVGSLAFAAPNNDGGGHFAISGSGPTYTLITTATALPTGPTTLNITLKATENGGSVTASFAITVSHAQPPVAPTNITLSGQSAPDNAAVGYQVGTATATMSDGSTFSGTWSLISNPNGYFAIDSGGNLTVAASLNGLANTTQNITIQATQAGQSFSKSFGISVTDHTATALTQVSILSNPSTPGTGSAQTNALVSHGMMFAKGAVPSNAVPRLFVTGGGAQVANQAIDHQKYWSDGSLKTCTMHYVVPALPGTASLTDAFGNATSIQYDLKVVSGTENNTGITLAAFQSWASTNSWNVRFDLTLDGVAYYADANTALAGSTSWSVTGNNYRGIWTANSVCTEFVGIMPVRKVSDNTPHRILLAGFHVRAYHPGGTIQDVRTDPYIENGSVDSFGNGDVPVDTITLKQGNTVVWQRSAVTTDATLVVNLAAFQPVAGNSNWDKNFCSGYVTGGTFQFDPTHVGRVIRANGQLIKIRDVNQPTIVVTAKGSGYTSAPTVNSGGTAVLTASVSGGQVQSISVTTAGTVGAISFSGGGGSGATAVVKNPDAYVVQTGGAGYTSSPTMTNTNSGAQAVVQGGSVVWVYPINPVQLSGAPACTGGGATTNATVLSHVSTGVTGFTGYSPTTGTSICKLQTNAATSGSLTLNGQCTISGVAYPRMEGGRTVRLYSTTDNSAVTFTINGTATDGATTETLTGPAARQLVFSAHEWETITSIAYSGSAVTNIQVGHGGQPASPGQIGSVPYDVTYNASVTSANWKILGVVIPSRTRLSMPAMRTWHAVVPRYYLSFDSNYLLQTRVLQNYAIGEATRSVFLSQVSNQINTSVSRPIALNNLPAINAPATYPDSKDYNPFHYTAPDGECMGFFTFESTSGTDAGIGSDSSYELYWLVLQTWDSWRNAFDRAHAIFQSPVWYRDENTGLPLDPAIRTTYSSDPRFGTQTAFSPQDFSQAAVGTDSYYGNFMWWNTDLAHSNAKCRIIALMTGDLKWLEAMQFNFTGRWLIIADSGNGLTRSAWGSTQKATSQERTTAWFHRDLIHASIHAPDTPHTSGIILDTSATGSLRTILANWFSQGYNALVVGPDGYGKMPSDKNDYHWWGHNEGHVNWQTGYVVQQYANLYENELLDSNGQQVMDWIADYLYQCYANKAVQARYLGYVTNNTFVHKGSSTFGYCTSMADLWQALMEFFPSGGNDATSGGSGSTQWPGPVAGLSVTAGDATVLNGSVTFKANIPIFLADHVTSFIAGTQKTITVTNSSNGTITCTAHGYADGQVVRISYYGGTNVTFPTTVQPRTNYYAHVIDANTLQLFKDAAMTTPLTFDKTGGLRVYAGEAQVTSTNASGSNYGDTIVCTVIAPFPNNSGFAANTASGGTTWILSAPATVTAPQQVVRMWPHGGQNNSGVIPEYSLTWRWSLAAYSVLPTRYSQCVAAFNAIKGWTDADGINVNVNGNQYINHSCTPR